MDCLFCSIVAGDVPSRKVHEDDQAYAFLDIEPWHKGHTLVVPKRHVDDLTGDPQVLAEIAPAVSHVARLLVDRLDAVVDGPSIGASGSQSTTRMHTWPG